MPLSSYYDLEFKRIIRAPRAEVFAAFIDPEAIYDWWAPKGWYTPHVEMDVRVGGQYRFGMRNDEDPALMFVRGEYLVVDRPNELKFTYIWEPGGAGERWRELALIDHTTVVSLQFRDFGDDTEVLLHHDGFPLETGAEQHRHGWSSNWDCLEDYLLHRITKPRARS
jgi:uncharacterized protein YndB with AHSA1/START domain